MNRGRNHLGLAVACLVLVFVAARAEPLPRFYRVWQSQTNFDQLLSFAPFGDGTVLDWESGSATGLYSVLRSRDLLSAGWLALAFGDVTNLNMSCALPGDNGIAANSEIALTAKWSGEDSDIGFAANEIYVLRAGENVSEYVRLTTSRWNRVHFAISPNGRYLADSRCHEDTDNSGDINAGDWKTLWVVDLITGVETSFVRNDLDACIGGVDWSPDSEWIYYAGRDTNDNAMNIYRQRTDGSEFSNLTVHVDFGVPDAQKWVSDVNVSWDGALLGFVFKKTPLISTNKMRVCTLDVGGTNLQYITDGGPGLTNGLGPYGPGDFDPEFSPDNRQMCFQRATDEHRNWGVFPSHDICTVTITNGAVSRLTPASNRWMYGISDWSSNDVICCTGWYDGDGAVESSYVGCVTVDINSNMCFYDRLPRSGTHARWIKSN